MNGNLRTGKPHLLIIGNGHIEVQVHQCWFAIIEVSMSESFSPFASVSFSFPTLCPQLPCLVRCCSSFVSFSGHASFPHFSLVSIPFLSLTRLLTLITEAFIPFLILSSYCPLFRFFPWRVFLFLPSIHFVKLPFLLSPPSVSFPSFHHLASFPGLPPTIPFFVANFISLPLYLSFFFNLSFPCRTFLLRFCLSFLRCSLIYFLSLPHFSFLASFSCALFLFLHLLASSPTRSLILSSLAAYFHLFSPFHSFSSDASSSCRTYLAHSSHVLSFCFLMCPHLPFVCIPPPSSSSSSSLYLSVLAFQYCSIPNAQHLLISSFQTYPFLLDFSNGKRKTVHVGVCKWLLEIHIDRTSCGRRAGGFFFFFQGTCYGGGSAAEWIFQ